MSTVFASRDLSWRDRVAKISLAAFAPEIPLSTEPIPTTAILPNADPVEGNQVNSPDWPVITPLSERVWRAPPVSLSTSCKKPLLPLSPSRIGTRRVSADKSKTG